MSMLFPPILNNSQPAFNYNTMKYLVYFTLPVGTALKDVGNVQIKITYQSNNKSIVNYSKFPDGIIYKNANVIKKETNSDYYYVVIDSADLDAGWQPGVLYKIQLAFGSTAIWTDISDFTNWKNQQIQNQTFSDWSTVMITKAITPIAVSIVNAEANMKTVLSLAVENSLSPLFIGQASLKEEEKEVIDKYRFILYDKDNNLIESSGWLQHNANANNSDQHRFKIALNNSQEYKLRYEIISNNGYQVYTEYKFIAYENIIEENIHIMITADNSSVKSLENGCIQIFLTSTEYVTGHYVLTRTSERSNYQIWEDVCYLHYSNELLQGNEPVYVDYLVEDNVKYQYGIQRENSAGFRTNRVYEVKEDKLLYRSVDLDYAYLFRDNIQLKLKFNNKVSSFKHTVLASKADTLGSKYPTISRNGHAYYAEFPITGLITLNMDKELCFLDVKSDYNQLEKKDYLVYSYKGKELFSVDTDDSAFSTQLTYDNIHREKVFRDCVEDFLNDGNYKLYRSATEGNKIIGLMNISLTPNQTLGRMIYEFSATAYEVAEYNLENLNKYGIIDIGGFREFTDEDADKQFGQICGLFQGETKLQKKSDGTYEDIANSADDLYQLIQKQVSEITQNDEFPYKVNRIIALRIEDYPIELLKNDYNTMNYELRYNKDLKTDEVESLTSKVELIENYLEREYQYNNFISIIINDSEEATRVFKNRVLCLNDVDITSLKLAYTAPVMISYVCTVSHEENYNQIITSHETLPIWGQLNGVFTTDEVELTGYNPSYTPPKDPDNVDPNRPVQIFASNSILTKYNVYDTQDIFDAIHEDCRKQIKKLYKLNNDIKYDKEEDSWKSADGVYFNLDDLMSLSIEGDVGTRLLMKIHNQNAEPGYQDTVKEIVIGPTEHYMLFKKDPESVLDGISIKAVELKSPLPTYLLVNYKVLTTQFTKGGTSEDE